MQWCAWPAPLLIQPARPVVASTGSSRARTSTCAVSLDPFDSTSWLPSGAEKYGAVRQSAARAIVVGIPTHARSVATAAIDPIDVGNCPGMIASPPEYGCKVLLQCVTIVGVVRIFFETAKEIRSRQRLSGFDLPVCNFLRIGIDDRGSCCITRIARIAGRKTSYRDNEDR